MASHSRSAPREDADGVRVSSTPGARVVVRLAESTMLLVVVATVIARLLDVPRAGRTP